MKLRKINRGIVLGCIALVATASYVIYDNIQFSKNQTTIANSIESYLDDLSNARCSVKDKNDLVDTYKDVIGKYWTSSDFINSGDITFTSKTQLISDIDDCLKNYDITGYFVNSNIKVDDVSVSKYGNNGAIATVEYKAASEFYGAPLNIEGGMANQVDNENYTFEDGINTDPNNHYKQITSYSDTFYLTSVDGKWMIAGAQEGFFGYETQTKRITDEDSSSLSDTDNSSEQKGGADSE